MKDFFLKQRLARFLTVPVIKEVGDGGRGAATPGLGCVNGGENGGHEPLVAVDPKALLTELGVVVGQAQQVTWWANRERKGGFIFKSCWKTDVSFFSFKQIMEILLLFCFGTMVKRHENAP